MKPQHIAPALLIAVLATVTAVAPLHAQIGIGAGLNFNSLDDIEAGSSRATVEGSTGYHVGLFANLGSGALSLRPGIYYHRIGTYEVPSGEDFDLSAVEVPIDVRLTVVPTGVADVFVLAGPVLTFPRSSDGEGAVEDVSLSADIGAGVGIRLPGVGLTVMPELRYSVGVTNYLTEEFQLGGVSFMPTDGERRVSKLMLRLNVMF